jgi:hypothetical protein
MKAQFTAQPVQVMASRERPAQRAVWFNIAPLCLSVCRMSRGEHSDRAQEAKETRLTRSRSQKSITTCFTCSANHFKLQSGLGFGGNILETLFVLLVAVTLAAGFGLVGVYIGARFYY